MQTNSLSSLWFIGLLFFSGVLIFLSMVFSASESAFLSINTLRLRLLKDKKHKQAMRSSKLLEKKELLLNTILIANNIVNISLSTVITAICLELFGNAAISIATGIVTLVLLVFGEISPKTIGTHHPETIAFLFSGFIQFFSLILKPFVIFFSFFSNLFLKLLGIKKKDKTKSFSEEEIIHFIEIGEEEGVVEAIEKKMLHRVFKFTDLDAKNIMVPRMQITFVKSDASYTSIMELSQKTHLSKFPVIQDTIDTVLGILHVKDMLPFICDKKSFAVKKIMREPLYILETTRMSQIQELFRQHNQSIAIVLDEYSGTSGLVTKEDFTQEVFGTMYDEYDSSEIPEIQKLSQEHFLVSGNSRLFDINKKTGLNLSSDYYETLAGFIHEQLDELPEEGQELFFEDYSLRIEKKEKQKILLVSLFIQVNE